MKTNTSKKSFVFRSLLVLPLTALLLTGFTKTRQIEREGSYDQTIKMDLKENGNVELGHGIFNMNEIPGILKQDFLQTVDAKKTKVEISVAQTAHINTINKLTNVIRTTGIYQIEVFANEVVMDKDQFKEDVPITPATTILNAQSMTLAGGDTEVKVSQTDLGTYNLLAKKYNAMPIEKRVIPLKDLKVLETIYRNMDKAQKENAQPFPECLPDNKVQQQSASREEMKEYNALAKKYNDMDHNHMIINKKEVMRLKIIYGKMSEKQRADAEPFPNFPPPPPAPDATKPPKAPSAVKKVKGTQPNLPPAPPIPPTPPTPMEHIKEMAAKGATFMYNGKEISAKKAIEVIKNNRKINIDSREANGDHPIVKLSTEPIVIEN